MAVIGHQQKVYIIGLTDILLTLGKIMKEKYELFIHFNNKKQVHYATCFFCLCTQ